MDMSDQRRSLALKYLRAKSFVIDNGYFDEINYYDSISFDRITETVFIKETAWVILSSGMSEKVISKLFSKISEAFFNWSIERIINSSQDCRVSALQVFNNKKKIDAILNICKIIYFYGIDFIKQRILESGISYLSTLPYIGDITAYHLAKNLGFNCSKPDRHLSRIAGICGYDSPHSMCIDISTIVGDDEKVIDLVFWRFATLNRDYTEYFNITEMIVC